MYSEKDDLEAVTAVIRRNMYWAIGPEIKEFEGQVGQYIGRKYALAFNSGTSALHALMIAYGIGEGNEVIVPSFSFIATANAPLFVGARPTFAEIEEKTYALSTKDVEKRITKKTRAIMPIHYGGSPALEINELRELAEKHGLTLIEDAAESLGASISNKKVGTFGDSAILSFCSNKVISTGEGGMVVTDNPKIYERLLLIRSQGRAEGNQNFFNSAASMDYVTLGYNMRMPTMVAALGISQFKKIEKIIGMRQKNARQLSELLSRSAITLPYLDGSINHVFQMYTVRFKDQKTRDRVKEALAKDGIMSKVYFDPIHLTHFYKNELAYKATLPITERIGKETLTLPLYTHMEDTEIELLAKSILKAMA